MPSYNWKSIGVVPGAKDFIDIVLSKTQRGTPTVCHNGWAVQRIRQFYMRKVKFTHQNWAERLQLILDAFPKVDDIHPFYSDLLNVLYDKDHYKLALGQVNTAKKLIDRIAQDYIRLLKYGDSLYRCKQLKRAALGRMCTLMKRQGASLEYLEQVRQHLARLPGIDPTTRTLLLCGYPNVGKSSLMNKLTRADVEVQPYAFTTKSLYVGHMDYLYMRWQVLDTPGILDRPLEERNTIEMQSITALAHLRAAVLYLVDISEQCGYSIAQQAALFHSIRPLFANKPVLIICNKVDARPLEALTSEERTLIDGMVTEARRMSNGGVLDASDTSEVLLSMSTLTDLGITHAKHVACERLRSVRAEMKVQSNRVSDVLNRIHVALPKPRDGVARPPVIPSGVAEARARRDGGETRRTQRQEQEENGGAGVYNADLRKQYMLDNAEWSHDIIPEIINGHNIADFVDPDIDARLAELEREEDELAAEWEAAHAEDMEEDEELTEEQAADLEAIRARKRVIIAEHRLKKSSGTNRTVVPHKHDPQRRLTTANMRETLGSMGIDTSRAEERARSRSQSRVGRKRTRSAAPSEDGGDVDMAAADGEPKKRVHSSKSRSMSRGRTLSLAPAKPNSGLKDAKMRNKGVKMADTAQRLMNKMARSGEADRVIQTKMPKHLFSGKRGKGKTDRR